MSAITVPEVVPGLVVHLDPEVIRIAGGAQTNAERTAAGDRAVRDPHYFLILEVDVARGTCLAVPLFSKYAPGSELLDEAKKTGNADLWIGEESYFSRWQHWIVPLASLPVASTAEASSPATRRRYAEAQPSSLVAIAAWRTKSRAPFRPL